MEGKEKEITVEELAGLLQSQEGEFIIHVEPVSYTHLTLPTT